jgi:hypothetical protein
MVNTGGDGEVGVSRITSEVAKVVAQVPPVLESLTGLRIDQLIDRLRQAATGPDAAPPAAPAPGEPPPQPQP